MASKDYTIDRVERVTVNLAGNVPENGYRVWFVINETGTADYVDVRAPDYNSKTVNKMIDDRVKTHLGVFGITPDTK